MEQVSEGRAREWLLRTAGLLIGTLALAVAFIAAYVGALHDPTPRDLPVGFVLGDQRAEAVLAAVRGQSHVVEPIEYDDAAAADDGLHDREVYGVLASDPQGGLLLTVASASGPSATTAIAQVFTTAAQRANTPLRVTDRVPVASTDPRGVVPFYLNVGYVLGGYLASTVLGIAVGTTPRTLRRSALRIAALTVYSVVLGVAGALVVGPGLGAFAHHLVAIAATGALTVLAAAMIASAIQGWLGILGTGLVILLLVVVGNPGSGGIYAPEFLPDGLRGMHRWNVPGLANDLTKSAVYFHGRAALWPAVGLAVWAVVGAAGLLTATLVRGRRAAVPTRVRSGSGEASGTG
ncbi:hypothetical protein OG994_20325 [Micromonospora globbae]|uniref:DUF3533 domain-containing protein n=1 Tax=Micromonospora globbae TaxID=1894969 RepID=A0ABZ1S0V4_9ACTN|nr:hypothetical protein [Micromonospora globbae]WTF87157.1 hypothetical protein OH732_06115 [Micromonospora globbae]